MRCLSIQAASKPHSKVNHGHHTVFTICRCSRLWPARCRADMALQILVRRDEAQRELDQMRRQILQRSRAYNYDYAV